MTMTVRKNLLTTENLSNWEKRRLADFIRNPSSPRTLISKQEQGFQLLNIERDELRVAKRAEAIISIYNGESLCQFLSTLENEIRRAA